MATLDELVNIDGVAVAAEWSADGTLQDYKANMDVPDEMAGQMAQFCATVSMMFNTLAFSFTQLSGMQWVPQRGWAYSGGEWTVAIGNGGNQGIFIDTTKADFNQLFETLAS